MTIEISIKEEIGGAGENFILTDKVMKEKNYSNFLPAFKDLLKYTLDADFCQLSEETKIAARQAFQIE